MPRKNQGILWMSKDFIYINLIILSLCGFFQFFILLLSNYFFKIEYYSMVISLVIGVTLPMFWASDNILQTYMKYDQRFQLRDQYKKRRKREESKRQMILAIPIIKSLLIVFSMFTIMFFTVFFICYMFIDNYMSFFIAEHSGWITCIITSTNIKKYYKA